MKIFGIYSIFVMFRKISLPDVNGFWWEPHRPPGGGGHRIAEEGGCLPPSPPENIRAKLNGGRKLQGRARHRVSSDPEMTVQAIRLAC